MVKKQITTTFLLLCLTGTFVLVQAQDNPIITLEAYDMPGYFVTHMGQGGPVAALREDGDLTNAGKFYLVPGLANPNGISFESVEFPGNYLRHRDWVVRLESDTTDIFYNDATWMQRPGLADPGAVSFESTAGFVGNYLIHDPTSPYGLRMGPVATNGAATWRLPLTVNPYASRPSPKDGDLLINFPGGILGKSLSWKKGDLAVSHNVYFGEDFDEVNEGTGNTFRGNQNTTYFLVGYGYTPNDPLPGGLVPGKTYYWRVDEVNNTDPNSPWKGDIWSFSLPVTKAYEPVPTDGMMFIDPNANLSWESGFGGVMQTVYFDEDYDAVKDATTVGVQVGDLTTYDPGSLKYDTTYYWRVDTVGIYGQQQGDIWSFKTTLPGLGTVVFERWLNFTGSVPELRSLWRYPNNPDEVETLTQFSRNGADIDNYGARIYGWVYAPTTGDYTFWLSSDDNGELWLSTDDDSSNMEIIAQESSWRDPYSWGGGEEQSDPIPLVAGNRYYIEALWQQGTGGEHCMVAWRGPGVEGPTVIPGNNLSPYRPLNAYGARPANRATGVTQTPILQWKPGIQAASHELYFGTDEDAVRNATKASPEYKGPFALGSESYELGKLAWESTYYWRVDEVNNTNPDSPWVGSVWGFTTADYAIVDDFEDYNTTDKQIWAIWHDGLGYWDLQGTFHPGNGTGSGVGDEENDNTYMEETIVNVGSTMSMPYFYNNNDPAKAKYSEAKLTLSDTRDWTEEGVKALSLWFRGYAASVGSFTDNLDGTYTMTGSGADIWDNSDQFHFAYKSLTGAGSIIARVDSVQNTDGSAKGGVMIRNTLDPNSAHAMIVLTPSNDVRFERRPIAADASQSDSVTGTPAPHWVRLDRDITGNFTAYHSTNGSTWEPVGPVQNVAMNPNVYIGLVVTSHNAALTCQVEFSNVQVSASGPWLNQDIGILSNDPERIYVAVANSNGTTGTVYYEDNDNIDTDATLIDTWTEFNIDLMDFQDQGVNLTDVNSVAVGIGTRGSTTPGGAGKVYIEDIRLYRPRCVPDKLTLTEADLNSDCVVNMLDLEIMTQDWLLTDDFIATTAPSASSLVGHWPLDGNANDSSGRSNNGTPYGGLQWISVGQVGGAIELNGVNAYVDLPIGGIISSLSDCSVATWVNWTGQGGGDWQRIFDFGTNQTFYMFLAPQPMRFAITTNGGGGESRLDAPEPLTTDWHHVAVTIDGTSRNMVLYLDGVTVASGPTNTLPTDLGTTTQNWLGRSQYGVDPYFEGYLDDVRIYNQSLSQAAVAYLADITPGDGQLYVPVPSVAEIYEAELQGSRSVNLKDFAVLADQWLDEQLWPEW